ncbi:hypothetical protein F5888DRAFT_1703228 [Russula emetica]|nr:hypothetical protein F5888DRAFT_1703228 [Russula emetica]
MVVPLLQIVIFWPIHDSHGSLFVTKGKNEAGAVHSHGSPIRSFRPCCETALAFACVGVLPCLPPPHPSFSLSYHSLSPLPPSHAVVCLSFFF